MRIIMMLLRYYRRLSANRRLTEYRVMSVMKIIPEGANHSMKPDARRPGRPSFSGAILDFLNPLMAWLDDRPHNELDVAS